jgi:pimeloyl-ACP methyl ester carboxylesterase
MAKEFKRINSKYVLNAVSDATDFRDLMYRPALIQLKDEIRPPNNLNIRDQGGEGSCTGFGLAATADLLLARRGEKRIVSTRMLYEQAQEFDEWEGDDYQGSSCRGAVRGWHSMGVCAEDEAPYRVGEKNWELSVDQAKDARKTTVGAYYRVGRTLSDYHAALNEVGALYVSATIHRGWQQGAAKGGEIGYPGEKLGGHAFAIVGYNTDGFWVQNSWGEEWGTGGVALWRYEDWLENAKDAWVLRLAVSTPQVWHLTASRGSSQTAEETRGKSSPRRGEVVGHFIHIDDGKFDERGKYRSDLRSVKQTASLVANSDNYDHLLFYAHGGLNDINASARRVAAMKDVFKANRIYPFHFMYDTGLMEEIKDVVFGKRDEVEKRAAGITDFTDKLIENATRVPGRALWREMKQGATSPFDDGGAGLQTIAAFLEAFAEPGAKPKQVHVVGHSTGAILLASLLKAFGDIDGAPRIGSCLLMAPACTHDVFQDIYRPFLASRSADQFGIDWMRIFNLSAELEQDDTVTPVYRKSLLYLVSKAFEEKRGEKILGMQRYVRDLGRLPGGQVFKFEVSGGSQADNPRTTATTHGGFDNDVATMNTVLRVVLRNQNLSREFTTEDLDY